MESYKFHLSLPSTDKKTANNKTCVLFLISSLADGATQFLTGIDQSFSSGFFSWNIFKAGDIKGICGTYARFSQKLSYLSNIFQHHENNLGEVGRCLRGCCHRNMLSWVLLLLVLRLWDTSWQQCSLVVLLRGSSKCAHFSSSGVL